MGEIKTITFIVTKSCQFACKYCYLVGKNSNEVMEISMARKAIDHILLCDVLCREHKVVLDFIGGEPLLEIGLISDIVDYWDARLTTMEHHWKSNYSIRITTNGLLYNTKKVQDFIHKYKEILSISISIDGTKEKNDRNRVFPDLQGTYDKIIDNVRLWISQFPNESTKMTISHDDLPYIAESVIHHIEMGLHKLDINPVLENVWQDGDDKIFEEQLLMVADYFVANRYIVGDNIDFSAFDEFIGTPLLITHNQTPCGSMQLSIDAKGDFYTCLRFAKYSLRTKFPRKIGNVDAGIDRNLIRPFYVMDRQTCAPQECMNCHVASGCKRCPAEDYDSSALGTIFQQSNFSCRLHKAKVHAKNYYWNKLYTNYR